MDRMFIADKSFPREFSRVCARGYKKLVIEEGVGFGSYVGLFTDGDTMVLRSVAREDADGSDEAYMVLCREFGLAGYRTKERFKSKLSVIFLDNGWMLVTLWKGAITVSVDGRYRVPNVGVDTYPNVPDSDICWISTDRLLDYGKCMKDMGQFLFDIEVMLLLGGDKSGGMESFSFLHLKEEDIDLSLGYIARYLYERQMKEEAKQAKVMAEKLRAGNAADDVYGDEEEEDDEEVGIIV